MYVEYMYSVKYEVIHRKKMFNIIQTSQFTPYYIRTKGVG